VPLIELQRDPDLATLRRFGAIAFAVFAGLGTSAALEVLWFAGGLGSARVPLSVLLFAIGALAGASSIVRPRANRVLYVTLSALAYPFGFVVSYCVLLVLFFLVLTPIGLVLRSLGRDPLARALQRDLPSYWVAARGPAPRARYFRQF
jgi:hypothetical protein